MDQNVYVLIGQVTLGIGCSFIVGFITYYIFVLMALHKNFDKLINDLYLAIGFRFDDESSSRIHFVGCKLHQYLNTQDTKLISHLDACKKKRRKKPKKPKQRKGY